MKEAKETSLPEGRPRPEDDLSEEAGDRTQGRASPPAGLERVQMAARRSRQTRFTALLHHVDEAALLRSFQRQRRAASAGVDGMTVEGYERDLEAMRMAKSVHRHTAVQLQFLGQPTLQY